MLDHIDFFVAPTMKIWTLGAPLIASWSRLPYLAPSRGTHSFRLLPSRFVSYTDITPTIYLLSDMVEILLFCTAIVDQLLLCCLAKRLSQGRIPRLFPLPG